MFKVLVPATKRREQVKVEQFERLGLFMSVNTLKCIHQSQCPCTVNNTTGKLKATLPRTSFQASLQRDQIKGPPFKTQREVSTTSLAKVSLQGSESHGDRNGSRRNGTIETASVHNPVEGTNPHSAWRALVGANLVARFFPVSETTY